MGTRRTYRRLTPDELQRAHDDPEWIKGYVLGPVRSSDDPPELLRSLRVEKSWPEIDVVVTEAGLPQAKLNGVRHLYPREKPVDEGWPYLGDADRRTRSPATYLTPEEVIPVAAFLNSRPFAELFDAVLPHAVPGSEHWGIGQWLLDREATVYFGERLQRFFAAAADEGDAVVSCLG